MSYIRSHARLLLVAVCCAGAGAGAGVIATAGAATGNSTHPARGARIAGARRLRRLRRFAARTVHGTLVVRTRTGFATVTFDRGKVDSVNGRQLTLTEGTPKATYKTVTLTIPATARVRDNRQKTTLSQVKPGQRALVVFAPKRTFVIAHTPGLRKGATP
ncbi:MAG TPA: hypothetical protein VFN87_08715 [Solirubrobacteraceae bacterium]|nr:hypothetical protein [Solirubrobacteraceae bacterium]